MTESQEYVLKVRSAYWDNIKGILIALVVLGHFLWAYNSVGFSAYLVSWIYIFHMPAFIFAAGYLSKSQNSRSYASILKLVVIYIVFNTMMIVFSYFTLDTSFNLVTPYYSFWFLLSLIVWRLIIKYIENINGIVLISIIVAVLVGLWSDITNVLAISRTIVFFPFFIIGYKLPTDKINTFVINRKPIDYLKGIVLLLYTMSFSIVFIYKYTGLSASNLLMNSYNSPLDPFVRIVLFCIAGLMILSIAMLTPNKPMSLLCKWGRNSLVIYILHRFFTLLFPLVFAVEYYSEYYIVYAFILSVITLSVLGSDSVTRIFNSLINRIIDVFTSPDSLKNQHKKNMGRRLVVVSVILFLLLPVVPNVILVKETLLTTKHTSSSTIHAVMSSEHEAALNNAVSIAFVGDLILLQDQVRNGYSEESSEYEFDPIFEYANKYLSQADFAIGILEGPTAGEDVGYSTSNYGDGVPLYLNYPDSFPSSVKKSGIDMVSTANNHLLDKGEEGALRTLDVLDEIGLLHVGSSRNMEGKRVKTIIEIGDMSIGVLAYTFGSNGYSQNYFLEENTWITSTLAHPSSRSFKQVKASVLADFKSLQDSESPPDLIMVLPHMGTQFSHETDSYQDRWNDIFIEAGADIVLGSHAHAVQPIEYRTISNGEGIEKQVIIVNCPGNFVNSYVDHNGDATSIVEVYINPESKEVIAAGVIPMYTQSPSNGNFRALPIYSILTDPILQNEISTYEMQRVAQVQSIITSVMLGAELTLDQAQERYYLFPEGYLRQPVKAIEITEEMKSSKLYKLLNESGTICFVGDSITAGSENGGYGWYEPLMAAFPDNISVRKAWGSATTQTLLENSTSITEHTADLYVIAIGTNDVRYRNAGKGAMDTDSYIDNIDGLIENILNKKPSARFVLISPWLAQDNDPYTRISVEERDVMLNEYGKALQLYSEEKGYYFVDPNPSINKMLVRYPPSDYLIDHIHPNASAGIALYSEKVLGYYDE